MKDGKLFGKINIIDLLVIVIVIAALVMVVLKKTGRMGAVRVETGTDITYTVKVINVEQEVADSIQDYLDAAKAAGKPGDRLMANGELLDAWITDMKAEPHEEKAILTTSGDYITIVPVNEDKLDLTFTVQGHVSNNVKTELGTQEVRAGKNHIVKTTHFELQYGTILTCEWASGTGADY